MKLRNILVSLLSVVALALAGNVLADSQANATAKAASEIASSMKTDAQVAQESANLAVEDSNAVNAAQEAGVATARQAQEADVAAEGTSMMAADMIAAKDMTKSVANAAENTVATRSSRTLVSGDEPMNVGDSAQIQAPSSSVKAQDKTAAMLKQESGLISGDTNPVDEGDAAQIKSPSYDAKAQEATQQSLKSANNEAGAISGKYD